MMKKQRKLRNDRRHMIYVITNMFTGEQYVGITGLARGGSVFGSLRRRIQKHVQRAFAETKNWGLCENIRTWGVDAFSYGIVEIVRGKAAAHTREMELIREFNPVLNTFR